MFYSISAAQNREVVTLNVGDLVTIDHAVAAEGSQSSILDGYSLTIFRVIGEADSPTDTTPSPRSHLSALWTVSRSASSAEPMASPLLSHSPRHKSHRSASYLALLCHVWINFSFCSRRSFLSASSRRRAAGLSGCACVA